MKYVCMFFCCLLAKSAIAERLHGKITDKQSGEVIADASIYIRETNRYLISNATGEFVLPPIESPFTLEISHLNYRTEKIHLASPVPGQLAIVLQPADILLAEITIIPVDAKKLLLSAFKRARRPQKKTYFHNAFFRQLTATNGEASQVIEFVYDLLWTNRKVEGWKVGQSRYAELPQKIGIGLQNASFLTFSLSGYYFPKWGIQLSNINHYHIHLSRLIVQDKQTVAVIHCRLKNPPAKQMYANSIYYIGVANSKVYRLENELHQASFHLSTGSSLAQASFIRSEATFRVDHGEMPVLERIRMSLEFDLTVQEQPVRSRITTLLYVDPPAPAERSSEGFLRSYKSTQDHSLARHSPYNEAFWKGQEGLRQHPLEDQFIKMIESRKAFGTMINP